MVATWRVESVTQAAWKKKLLSAPNRLQTYDLLVTSPDALPLSYRILVETKPT